ncbi:hypothetical protein ACFLU8_00245 [Chloroflexota bacterium]
MAMLAWLFGFLGGLGMVMGVATALEIVPLLDEEFTWMFWFVLSALLLLLSIACAAGRSGSGGGGGGWE